MMRGLHGHHDSRRQCVCLMVCPVRNLIVMRGLLMAGRGGSTRVDNLNRKRHWFIGRLMMRGLHIDVSRRQCVSSQ